MSGTVEYIPTVEAVAPIEDCGRGHACSFCPEEDGCTLDKANHSKLRIRSLNIACIANSKRRPRKIAPLIHQR